MNKAKQKILEKIKNSKKNNVETILTLLKNGSAAAALQETIEAIDIKICAKFYFDKLKQSRYRSYSKAINDLERAVQFYYAYDGTIEIKLLLDDSLRNVTGWSDFNVLKTRLLHGIYHNDKSALYSGLEFLAEIEASNYGKSSVSEDIITTKLAAYAAELVAIKWPEKSAIRVLYG